ncbi:YdcF family protein [Nocardiopsis ganjiahuensis]|uniref:YdcF family protein n=1 Tax=Nocardiopsis ganjiahuensis TaxID=239984 RepID=UPI00034C8680|nr:YdcF family protein [Nocardiopsis ganjiahuensis]
MRTASDGRGDEPWEDPITTPASADNEATQVFSREGFADAGPTAEATREFTRGSRAPSDDGLTQAFPGDDGAADTREFTRSAPDGQDSAFTRRFVRDRPLPRTRGERPLHRDEVEEPGFDEPGFDERAEEPRAGERRRRGRRTPPPREPGATRSRRKRRRFRLRWIIALVLLTALAIPPGTWGMVWYTARQDDRTASDAIIVLGASQYNGVPSPVFEARLRQAQVLYLDGVAPYIVTVGGKQPDDAFTEAAAGRNWLVEVGVPADQVIAVEEGSDTLQSFQAVEGVFETNEWETAILVSDPWHSLRSKVMAADHGIEAGTSPSRSGPAVIERKTQLWYITRETASLWYYWIFNDSSDIRVNAA